jgi:hypothetical protein
MASFGVEPSADVRSLAHSVRELFVAMLDEGFTDRQALIFIGTWFGNTPPSQNPDDQGTT